MFRLLRWVVNSSTWYSWITVNVSSTYLNNTEGWGWRLCGEQSPRILPYIYIYIGLLLWATLVIPWLLRVSVCISLHCMWSTWCSGINSVVQGSSPVTEGCDLGALSSRPIWCALLWWHGAAGCWWTVLRHLKVLNSYILGISSGIDQMFERSRDWVFPLPSLNHFGQFSWISAWGPSVVFHKSWSYWAGMTTCSHNPWCLG